MAAKLLIAAVAALMGGDASLVARGAPAPQRPVLESRLLFTSNRTGVFQVYSVRRSGTGLVQLTSGRTDVREPLPSPDGRLVLYLRDDGVAVVRPDGQGARRISSLVGFRRGAAWARDSRRVAVGNGMKVEVVDVRTRRSRIVPGDGVPIGWSRDGRRLFVHRIIGCDSSCEVSYVDVARGHRQPIVPHAQYATVSPTGRRLAYMANRFGGTVHVIDTSDFRERGGGFEVGPGPLVWSPDGIRLAYVSGDWGDAHGALADGVRLAHVERGVTTLTEDGVPRNVPAFAPSFVPAPAWTPSGDAVTYVGVDGIRTRTLSDRVVTTFRTSRDGGEVRDLAWARGARLRGARAAEPVQPLQETTGSEVRLRHGAVDALAVDGDVAAFITCNNIATWRQGASAAEWVGPSTCPSPTTSFSRSALALAEEGIVSLAWTGGGNSQHFMAGLSRQGRPESTPISAGFVCCTGGPRRGTAIGGLLGSGPLLVFSHWRVSCPQLYDSSCGVSAGPQSVWRLHGPAFQGACPVGDASTSSGPCTRLAAAAGLLAPIAIDDEHVLLLREGGSLTVVDGGGTVVRTFGFAPGEAAAAEIDGDDVVVAVPGLLLHYSLATGVLRHSWPLPAVSTGGFCGAPILQQCPVVRLRLEDVRHGLAAYLLDGELHVLRLADGRNRRLQAATAARFGDSGLFVAYGARAPWPGRLRFVSLAEVVSTLR